MARKLRVEYEGAIYHVINRGDRQEAIFRDDADRELFLKTLDQCCTKTDWQVHAWCLMGNHFHLVIETPQANLVIGMKWFLGTYTGRFNRRHKLFGHVFSGRYKAQIVDGSGNGYLKTVCDYVHLNPVRANLLVPEQPLEKYRWSSYRSYLSAPGKRPKWLRVDRVLGEAGIPRDSTAGRREFVRRMEQRRALESEANHKPLRRGWCLGNKQFRKELMAQMSERMGPNHYGADRHESAEQKAERLVAQELKLRCWSEATLSTRRKGDPQKIQIAARLRRDTVMTLKWIARRLQMGSWTNVSNCLAGHRKYLQSKKCQ